MKKFITIFLYLYSNFILSQSTEEINLQKTKLILTKINTERLKHSLTPLIPNQNLVNYSKFICERLQQTTKDTSVRESVVFFNDKQDLPSEYYLNSDYEIIGIWTLPHKYYCQITVITFDKFLRYHNKYLTKCPKRK